MLLKVYVSDNELKGKYDAAIEKHNMKLTDSFPDAGFDLFTPRTYNIASNEQVSCIDMGIKCAAFDKQTGHPTSYYLYPRSSISKTPFRLANSVGIIDSGYRGNIKCMVDKLGNSPAKMDKHSRYFQICSPTLLPIQVVLVNSESELGETTRGSGGFGSTGR